MNQNYIIGSPLPAAIGRCADLYKEIRDLRLAMQAEVDAVKARETEVKEHIIANLAKSDDTGAAGLRYRAQIVMKNLVKVNDWGVLHSWISKNDRFDMLQKRINEKPALEWMEETSRKLPGTEVIHVPDVSVTKI